MATEEQKAAAEILKAEGNAAHVAKRYQDAYAKYTEAIKVDGSNAIYYANRAASSMCMKKYLDAACDAKEATKLDPAYIKGWTRLGAALQAVCAYEASISAWETALSLFADDSQLSPTDLKIKLSCKDGLKEARKTHITADQSGTNTFVIPKAVSDANGLPWQRAMRITQSNDRPKISSAYIILHAWKEFSVGVAKMKMLTELPGGMIRADGGVIVSITNGIISDPRVFHIDDPDWITLYNKQVFFETQVWKTWKEEGPAEVERKAIAMQETQGWDVVRPALASTVRLWFMKGFMFEKLKNDYKAGLEYYGNIIRVLEWGLRVWKDVSNEDRGAIFRPTFIRAIRRFRMEAYMAACKIYGSRENYSLDELDRMAKELIDESAADPPPQEYMHDQGFCLAFYIYPYVEGHATRGFVAMQKAMALKDVDANRANGFFSEAYEHYMSATKELPLDEEKRLLFMKCALDAAWFKGDTLESVLSISSAIREQLPGIAKIWEQDPFLVGIERQIVQVRRYEAAVCVGLVNGTIDPNGPATVVDLTKC